MKRQAGPFTLEVGGKFFIPEGAVTRRSKNEVEHPDTPVVYWLRAGVGNGKFYFNERRADGAPYEPVFKLFAPAGLKPDDMVVVVWSDPKCACVRQATTDEHLAATSSGGCTSVI